MDEMKSKVYVLIDERNRILRCEGGYTMSNIEDISAWTLIDEGTGDKYNLCQSNYFDPPLFEEHGVPVWELVDGAPRLRAQEDVDADIAALPPPPPTAEERIAELELKNAEYEAALTEIENALEVTE